MQLVHGFQESATCRGGFVSIGNFDGVHRGHERILRALVERARSAGVPAVVLTFDPHPIRLLRPAEAPPRLSTLERKAHLLARSGVDVLIAYPTDRALLDLRPEQFFERIVHQELAARGLVEGPNFCFGRNRSGDVTTLRRLCASSGILLEVVPPLEIDGGVVSSSRIRALILEGRIAEAVDLLGHPYRVRGRVIHGADRGRALGFPTANLDGVATLLPKDGVYAGRADYRGESWPAAVHLGPNPTFDETARKLEIHLLDFAGDLYGQELDVDFLARLRDTASFEDAAALRQQLERDLTTVRAVANREVAR